MAVTKLAIEKAHNMRLRMAKDSPAHAWVGDSTSAWWWPKSITFQLAGLPNAEYGEVKSAFSWKGFTTYRQANRVRRTLPSGQMC